MAKTGVSLNWGGLDKALGNAVDGVSSHHKATMKAIGEALVSSTKRRFIDGHGPDETPWKPSARATAKGGKTLVDTAGLQKSINAKITTNTVYVGTNLEYARIHQLGGEIKPKNKKALKFPVGKDKWATVQKVTMPARPYLGISDEDREEVKAIIADHLKEMFGG